ncbi:unnamed protein product [Rotaria magnacalcarata]
MTSTSRKFRKRCLFTQSKNLQNLLIWLDSDIPELSKNYYNSIEQLRTIIQPMKTFNNVDQCIEFFTTIEDKNVVMVTTTCFAQQIVPEIHDVSALHSIYIVCANEIIDKQWIQHWPKVKGIFTRIDLVCQSIEQSIWRSDRNIRIGLIAIHDDLSNQNLDEIDGSFMYTQLLKEILLEFEYNEESAKEFASYCREQYADSGYELSIVDRFEREYNCQTPIWWYTFPCFIYSLLNGALRTQEIETIITMGFFISDLHRQIEKLHAEQMANDHREPFIVYRGQGISNDEFKRMQKSQGGLLSFNSFLSTSTERDVSYLFAESNTADISYTGILFHIAIDPAIPSAPYARLNGTSYFSDNETEILFSMHTTFRIGEIQQINECERLWQVNLTLTADTDQLLATLTEKMREEIKGSTGWHQLGKLLIKLGALEQAEELYLTLLCVEYDDNQRRHFYHCLGLIKYSLGNYAEAIAFYEKALQICQQTLPPNHPNLAASYNNLASVYVNMHNYVEALSFAEKSIKISEESLPANHPDLAAAYNNIGGLYFRMGEYSMALTFHQKDLEIRQKALPCNHPSLATSYHNIGLLHNTMGHYSEALSFHDKALGIQKKILPPNHPDLAQTCDSIGSVYENMGQYSNALSFYEQSLSIRQQALPVNHPDLATSYSHVGSIYGRIGEYTKALFYQKKTLEIREKNHPLIMRN